MLNMDFLKEVLIDSKAQTWQASPMAGVWRKPLAREEAERGHATSIVKYEAGSFFRSHPHPGGEEIMVLKGTFSDESGDYHEGAYFRNPAGTSHAPHSKEGCELLVKLHQFQVDDRAQINIDTQALWQENAVCELLHEHKSEKVFWLKLNHSKDIQAYSQLLASNASTEVLVIEGELNYKDKTLSKHAWLRSHDFQLNQLKVVKPAILWFKSGHF